MSDRLTRGSFFAQQRRGLGLASRVPHKLKVTSEDDYEDPQDLEARAPKGAQEDALLASYGYTRVKTNKEFSREISAGSAGSSAQRSLSPSTVQLPSASSVDPEVADFGQLQERSSKRQQTAFFDLTTCSFVNVPNVVQKAIHSLSDKLAKIEEYVGISRKEQESIRQNMTRIQEMQHSQFEGLKWALAQVGRAMTKSRKGRQKAMGRVLGSLRPAARSSHIRPGSAGGNRPGSAGGNKVLQVDTNVEKIAPSKSDYGTPRRVSSRESGRGQSTDTRQSKDSSRHSEQRDAEAEFGRCSSSDESDSSTEPTVDQLQFRKLQEAVDQMQASVETLVDHNNTTQFKLVSIDNELLDLTAMVDHMGLEKVIEKAVTENVWTELKECFPKWLKSMGAIERETIDAVMEFFELAKTGAQVVRDDLTSAFEIVVEELTSRITDIEQEVSELFDEEEFCTHHEEHLQRRNTVLIDKMRQVARKPSISVEEIPDADEPMAMTETPSATQKILQALIRRNSGDLKETKCRHSSLAESRKYCSEPASVESFSKADEGLGFGKKKMSLSRRLTEHLPKLRHQDDGFGEDVSRGALPLDSPDQLEALTEEAKVDKKDGKLKEVKRKSQRKGSARASMLVAAKPTSPRSPRRSSTSALSVHRKSKAEDLNLASEAVTASAEFEEWEATVDALDRNAPKMSVPAVSVTSHAAPHPPTLQLPVPIREESGLDKTSSPRNLSVDRARTKSSSPSRNLREERGRGRKDSFGSSSRDSSDGSERNSPAASLSPSSSRHRLCPPSGSSDTPKGNRSASQEHLTLPVSPAGARRISGTQRLSTSGFSASSPGGAMRKSVRPNVTAALSMMDEKTAQHSADIKELQDQVRSDGHRQFMFEMSVNEEIDRIAQAIDLRGRRTSIAAEQNLMRQGVLDVDRRLETLKEEFHDSKDKMYSALNDELHACLDETCNETLTDTVNRFESEFERISCMATVVFPRAKLEDDVDNFSASEARWYVLDSRCASLEDRLHEMESRIEDLRLLRDSSPAPEKRRTQVARRTRGESMAHTAASRLRQTISKGKSSVLARSTIVRADSRKTGKDIDSFANAILAITKSRREEASQEEPKSLADVMRKAAKAARGGKASSPAEMGSLAGVALAAAQAAKERRQESPALQEVQEEEEEQTYETTKLVSEKISSRIRRQLTGAITKANSEERTSRTRGQLTGAITQQVGAVVEAGSRAPDSEQEPEGNEAGEQRAGPEFEVQGTVDPEHSPEGGSNNISNFGEEMELPHQLQPIKLKLTTHRLRDAREEVAAEAAATEAMRKRAAEVAVAEAQKVLAQQQKSGGKREFELEGAPPPLSDVPIHGSGSTLPLVTATAPTTGTFHCTEAGRHDPFIGHRTIEGTVLGSGWHKDQKSQVSRFGEVRPHHLPGKLVFEDDPETEQSRNMPSKEELAEMSPREAAKHRRLSSQLKEDLERQMAAGAGARGAAPASRPHSAAARGSSAHRRPSVPRGVSPGGRKAIPNSNTWEAMRIDVEPEWEELTAETLAQHTRQQDALLDEL